MNKDRVVGIIILVMSVLILLVYSWFLIVSPMIVLQITALIAVGAVLVIAAWIGLTMAPVRPSLLESLNSHDEKVAEPRIQLP